MGFENNFFAFLRIFIVIIPLYSQSEFDSAKVADKLPCKCLHCNKIFLKTKRAINKALNLIDGHTGNFCSQKCHANFSNLNKQSLLSCTECGKKFHKKQSQIRKSKSTNHFCSKSCAATFNNRNKSHGTRRSKLEAWIEERLIKSYPNLQILFNSKEIIGSELDIYIPSLNLAFELNGIFHYEPIYGVDKFQQIQENDQSKSKACHDAKIDLCIIDTSTQKYFKESTSKKYLDIIINIIKERSTS